jgi:hypothetical protein
MTRSRRDRWNFRSRPALSPRMFRRSTIMPDDEPTHKFLHDSKMTFQEVYNFAFQYQAQMYRALAEEFGEDRFMGVLRRLASEDGLREGQEDGRRAPCNDFAAYVAEMRDRSYFSQHVLTFDIVEDTPAAFGIKVTECLWAKTFRELGAADIGYALICHPDYADCRGFNPRITMQRTKTLMQGHDCCDHRWVWEE